VHRQFDLKEWKTKGDFYNPNEEHALTRESKPRLQLVEGRIRRSG
jgi:hypothetical protein